VKSEGSIQNFIYTSNNGETFVEHYKVIDGEHVWFDFTFEGVSANQIIWNFLSRYSTNGLR